MESKTRTKDIKKGKNNTMFKRDPIMIATILVAFACSIPVTIYACTRTEVATCALATATRNITCGACGNYIAQSSAVPTKSWCGVTYRSAHYTCENGTGACTRYYTGSCSTGEGGCGLAQNDTVNTGVTEATKSPANPGCSTTMESYTE
jgi:hypothetical protein